MKTATFIIAVISKGNQTLLRKKPDGSQPYKETWYGFGTQVGADIQNPEQAIIDAVNHQTGIDIKVTERLWWDSEIKPDHDGEVTFFIYLDCLAEYVGGALSSAPGIERLEWVDMQDLPKYDIVPPSVKLFRKMGYLKG